jgi:[histone H3]-lysine36 N-dimethyltransferase SETMAR
MHHNVHVYIDRKRILQRSFSYVYCHSPLLVRILQHLTMSATKSAIRERLLHEFQLGRSAGEAKRNVCQALGYEAVKIACAKRWFQKFRRGDTNTQDKPRSGRPLEMDRAAVLQAVEDNPTLTTRMLSLDFICSHTAIKNILHAAGLRVRLGKWVPHQLTSAQKATRLDAARELLARHQQHPFLNRVVTCDEKWISLDNRRRSKQWLPPGKAALSTPKPDLHQSKVMLCVWWWIGGVIHWEFVERGRSINAELYCAQLERVQAKIRKPCLRQLFRMGVILQQDNARPHIARTTLAKIEQLGWERLVQPPYSPDIAPSDYHLFRSLEHSLAGNRFETVEAVKKHVAAYFASKPTQFYRSGIEKLPEKWQNIINCTGDYFN